MTKLHELIVSVRDVEVLARITRERGRVPALDDLLLEARRMAPEVLPADRVAIDSNVTYEEEPGGERRRVILVHPEEADAAFGRISVLSPVGLALLGRVPGARVSAELPGGRELTIRILETSPRREPVLA
jgi:regulator of nucleoside diphosphate kinase